MDFKLELVAPFFIGKMAWIANRVLVIFEKNLSRMALVDPFCIGKEIGEETDLKSLDVYAIDVLQHVPVQIVEPNSTNRDAEIAKELERIAAKQKLGEGITSPTFDYTELEMPQQVPTGKKIIRVRHESASVYMFGKRGARAYRLLNWQQRVNVMYASDFHKQAFDFAIEMYLEKVPKIQCVIGLPPAERRKELVASLISHLLRLFVSKSLKERHTDQESEDQALRHVGKICLQYCIEIENYDIIWDLCTKYEEQGKSDVFVELLTSTAILQGKLSSLIISSKLYDAIEEYHLRTKQIDTLEQVVLNLNINGFEFERLKQLCIRYRVENQLLKMWLYIHNVLRNNYLLPLDDLFDGLVTAAEQNQIETKGTKLVGNAVLEYMRNCFNGTSFTSAFHIPQDQIKKVKMDLLKYIFQDKNAKVQGGQRNYKYLETIIQFNASEFFEILSIAYADSGITAPFDGNEQEMNRMTQILITLMNNQKWRREQVSHFYTFLLRFMAKGIIPQGDLFQKIFKQLVTDKTEISHVASIERQTLFQEVLESDSSHFSWINDQVIKSVEENKLYQLSAYLYRHKGNYGKVISNYLSDPLLSGEVYPYLKELSSSDQIQLVRQAILENLRPLMNRDPERMSSLLASCHAELHPEVMVELRQNKKDETLLYHYLKFIISYAQTSAAIPITDDIHMTYVLLLCQFDKTQVPNYLTTFQTNDVSAILKACEKYEIPEAVSFLYEKVWFPKIILTILERRS